MCLGIISALVRGDTHHGENTLVKKSKVSNYKKPKSPLVGDLGGQLLLPYIPRPVSLRIIRSFIRTHRTIAGTEDKTCDDQEDHDFCFHS